MPSLSFSTPGRRAMLLDGRKTCTTRPFKAGKRWEQFCINDTVMIFWKARRKGVDPLAGRLFNAKRKDVRPITLLNPSTMKPWPCAVTVEGFQFGTPDKWPDVPQHWWFPLPPDFVDEWVKAEGFEAIEDLYDVLRGFYDHTTLRGLFYVVWWAWPPPAEQPDDAVWRSLV